MESIFSHDRCVRENTSQAASVEFVRLWHTNYAHSRLQAFCRKNRRVFRQSQTPHRHDRVVVRQYCAKIDEAARNRMELIVPELAKRNGVTEKLKAENQMEWVRQMNACKAQAEEVVKAELIYD